MDEQPFESERPPDEVWWERELNRNEKLMDKYMAALGDEPDWEKWKNPNDLYNKVHFGIDPPEHAVEGELEDPVKTDDDSQSAAEKKLNDIFEEEAGEDSEKDDAALIEAMNAACEWDEEKDELDNEPPDNEDYPAIAKMARNFAVQVMRFEDIPQEAEVLYLSAGKAGANLAGGHGLGYDDEAICGNIVKCRWALADCEFCREMLAHLHERTGRKEYEELRRQAEELATNIQTRITRLRARVWW